jgi:hypothetical protein
MKKGSAKNKREIEAHDKRNAAFHEAGHCIAAKHFRLDAHAYIVRVGEPTEENKAYLGRTYYQRQRSTKFRKAVITWSGLIAEYLADKPLNEWPDEDIDMFEDCTFPDEHSATDQDGLNSHAQWRRAMKTAWRIVVNRRDEVAVLARELSQSADRLKARRGRALLEHSARERRSNMKPKKPKPKSDAQARKLLAWAQKAVLGQEVKDRIAKAKARPHLFPGNTGILFDPRWQDGVLMTDEDIAALPEKMRKRREKAGLA